MAAPKGRHTLPGTALPEGELSPTLLFHKWHRYDSFIPETYVDPRGKSHDLKPFSRDETGYDFLSLVAKRVQKVGETTYDGWHKTFVCACEKVDAAPPLVARTDWRLVIGWATNPALEVGLTLDHLYGFPVVPGSAVKGLLHRVAELELEPLVSPLADGPLSPDLAPPNELSSALEQALRLRVLFGSLHLRPDGQEQPTSALVALEGWRNAARRLVKTGAQREAWKALLSRLETVCSDAATGGMLTCFAGVLEPGSFASDRPVLTVDVLTPHTENSPNPILFLAVRDGVSFEFRYRLANWPAAKPRDEEEAVRVDALAGLDRATVAGWLERWLVKGLGEQGLGGKTTAGYGYLHRPGDAPSSPELLPEPPLPVSEEPEDDLSPAERYALQRLPDDIDLGDATNLLNAELAASPSPQQKAFACRFVKLFPDELTRWEESSAAKKLKRLRLLRQVLGEEGS